MSPKNILKVARVFLGLRKILALASSIPQQGGLPEAMDFVGAHQLFTNTITPKKFCPLIQTKAGLAVTACGEGKMAVPLPSIRLVKQRKEKQHFLYCSPVPASLSWTPVLDSGCGLLTSVCAQYTGSSNDPKWKGRPFLYNFIRKK